MTTRYIKQLMHSVKVNIRICQPEKVMFAEAMQRLTLLQVTLRYVFSWQCKVF